MNQQTLAALRLLAQLRQDIVNVNKLMGQLEQRYTEACHLLQLNQALNTDLDGLDQMSQPQQQMVQAANTTTTAEAALWFRDNRASGNFKVKDNGTEISTFRLQVFMSKPESKTVMNGYVLPNNNNQNASLQEAALGNVFIIRDETGALVMKVIMNATTVNNNVNFTGNVKQVDKSTNDRMPDVKADLHGDAPFLTVQARGMMPQAAPQQGQAPVQNNFPLPANDNILTNPLAGNPTPNPPASVQQPQPPNVEGLFGNVAQTSNNLNDLLS